MPAFDVPRNSVPGQKTRWSVVLRAANGPKTPEAQIALCKLCETYWQTLYIVARKKGQSDEAALDSVQGFICALLDGTKTLKLADPERGRFRSFLWTCFSSYLIDEFRATTRQKVGGDRKRHSLDIGGADGRLLLEAVDNLTAEDAFRKSMALDTFQDAFDQLKKNWNERGKIKKFEHLQEYLVNEVRGSKAHKLASQLGVSEPRARGLVAELRQEFHNILRDKVAQTLLDPTPSAVNEELEWLWQALNL